MMSSGRHQIEDDQHGRDERRPRDRLDRGRWRRAEADEAEERELAPALGDGEVEQAAGPYPLRTDAMVGSSDSARIRLSAPAVELELAESADQSPEMADQDVLSARELAAASSCLE